jgi:hypothetical protein
MSVRLMPGWPGARKRLWIRFVMPACLAALFFSSAPAGAQTNASNSLTLSWIAPGDDGNQGQVSSYDLRYSTSAPAGTDTTGWWNAIPNSQRLTLGPPLASAGATDSKLVTGLTPGTTYYFVLEALDEAFNRSGFSNIAVGTTQSCNAPATAPGSFDAVADTGQVTVSWSATSDPLALSLHLYRAPGASGGTWTQIQNLSVGTTSYVDRSVTSGATYRYRAAYMGTLCEGPTTATKTVTLPGTPPPPPPQAATPSTIHAYPNPTSASLIHIALENGASASMPIYLRLFDLNGHWVATPVDGTYPPGPTEVSWNRIGRDGRTVGPGLYELIGTVGITRVRDRLVLLP